MTWTLSDREVRAALEAEWADLVRRGQVHWWPDDDGGGSGGAVPLMERCRAHDDVAWQLVLSAAQAGERRAARLALQAMLPSLAAMASRDRSRPFSEYVSAGWLRLYDHPIERRANRVQTNLVLDTLKALTRERDPRTRPQPPEWFHDPASVGEHWDGASEREGQRAASVITAATRLGVISAASAPVLRSVYADGLSGREAAARHHESHEMVRYRCSRAVRAMRAARTQLVQAA